MPLSRHCRQCEAVLPDEKSLSAKFCSTACRSANYRDKTRAKRLLGKKDKITPAMQNFRALAKYADIEDPKAFMREVLQETIRENVTQHVEDNLLGAGEALTALLPKVMAGLALDLESKDWMIRSRAQAAVLKYSFEFKNKQGKDQDLGTIQVVHNVALPNTPLGETIEAEIVEQEAGRLQIQAEGFEKDWPACADCGERKHPDAMRWAGRQHVCSSCTMARNYKTKTDVTGMLERDPEFGKFSSKDEE